MRVFRAFKVVNWKEDKDGTITCNNLTLINFVLIMLGPMREPTLTTVLLAIQVNNLLFFYILYKTKLKTNIKLLILTGTLE